MGDYWRKNSLCRATAKRACRELAPYKGQVVQRIVTPDGQLHKVIVPRETQYEEGDAILRSELNPPILEAFDQPPGEVEVAGEPINRSISS